MEDSLYEILFSSVHSIRRRSKLLGQINELSFFKKFILLYCSVANYYIYQYIILKVFSIWSLSRLNWNHLTFCPGAWWRWVISTTWITLNFHFYLKLKLFSPYLASKPLMQGRALFHGKNYRCHQSRQKFRTRSIFQPPRIFLLEILPRKGIISSFENILPWFWYLLLTIPIQDSSFGHWILHQLIQAQH